MRRNKVLALVAIPVGCVTAFMTHEVGLWAAARLWSGFSFVADVLPIGGLAVALIGADYLRRTAAE
jgi:hypothetical protein